MLPLRGVYDALTADLGRQAWWPADTPFEMMLGAILVQNTRWHNVTLAVPRLVAAGLLEAARWRDASDATVLEAIHPCGFHRAKLRSTRALADWYVAEGEAELRRPETPDGALRERLLTLPGVGHETADAILLYAFDRPVFVYDAYARRMFEALWGVPNRTYVAAERANAERVAAAAFSLDEQQQLHALIDEYGKLVAGGERRWEQLAGV